jgi:hypothetical protein
MLYTDPGSGMMLLQILLAFGASVVFYFRKYLLRIFGSRTLDGDISRIGKDHERD